MSRTTRESNSEARALSSTGLSPSMVHLSMTIRLKLGFVTSARRGAAETSDPTTPTTQRAPLDTRSVWAVSRSLAATEEIAIAFSS